MKTNVSSYLFNKLHHYHLQSRTYEVQKYAIMHVTAARPYLMHMKRFDI